MKSPKDLQTLAFFVLEQTIHSKGSVNRLYEAYHYAALAFDDNTYQSPEKATNFYHNLCLFITDDSIDKDSFSESLSVDAMCGTLKEILLGVQKLQAPSRDKLIAVIATFVQQKNIFIHSKSDDKEGVYKKAVSDFLLSLEFGGNEGGEED